MKHTDFTTIPIRNQAQTKRIALPVPPLSEQDNILRAIDKFGRQIEAAISIKQDQIAVLKEYKTCLINAAVTGKIKVI